MNGECANTKLSQPRGSTPNRWAKSGVLDAVSEQLQREQIVRIRIESVALDSTSVKVHSHGTGALKNGPPAIGKSRGG